MPNYQNYTEKPTAKISFPYLGIWERLSGRAGAEIQIQSWGEVVVIVACTIIALFFISMFM